MLPDLDVPTPLAVPGEMAGPTAVPVTGHVPDLGPDDELAALARSARGRAVTPTTSPGQAADAVDAADAADLVAEAVATYHDLHPEASGGSTDEPTASFPPLAKALVDGGRVSLEAMSLALEEHHLTGQSIARILTNQKLVTEADLMWGMAEEMGLQFVDLDTAGVDLTVAGALPESTARHHNVMVIAKDNGVPVVATSNPTDVFAMDDLRTIIGTQLHRRGGHPDADQRLHQPGVQQRRRQRHGHGGLARHRRRHPGQRRRRHPDDHRDRPDRPVRQPPHPPGPERAGLGRPHRADRAPTCGSATASTACSTTSPPGRRPSPPPSPPASR